VTGPYVAANTGSDTGRLLARPSRAIHAPGGLCRLCERAMLGRQAV